MCLSAATAATPSPMPMPRFTTLCTQLQRGGAISLRDQRLQRSVVHRHADLAAGKAALQGVNEGLA